MRVTEIFTLGGGDHGSRGSYAEGDYGDGYLYGGYYGNYPGYYNGYNDHEYDDHPTRGFPYLGFFGR